MTMVLGRVVTGEVVRNRNENVEQWTGGKFLEMLDGLLGLENVHSVRWTQYTPYFNDGEPCIFGVNEPSVKLSDGSDDDGDNGDGYLSGFDMIEYDGTTRIGVPDKLAEIHDALEEFEKGLPHFEDFLEETFGDHAVVTATTEGFDIAFYEHD